MTTWSRNSPTPPSPCLPGQYTKTPVKTEFGWHVIKVEDHRASAPPSFDEARQEVSQLVAHDVVDAKLKELRGAAKVETFGLDGKPLPPPRSNRWTVFRLNAYTRSPAGRERRVRGAVGPVRGATHLTPLAGPSLSREGRRGDAAAGKPTE